MPQWDYLDEIPFVPVRIYGKNVSIASLGLIDSEAKYCVIHEKLTRALELEVIGTEPLRGFGGRRKFTANLVRADIEIAGIVHNVTIASVSREHFPVVAPRIVVGRNLLNKFKITLDGPNKRIILD